MTSSHRLAVILATIGAVALLFAMLFGTWSLEPYIGVPRSFRDTAVALWGFLLPAWFVVEEAWFAPPPNSPPAEQAAFRAGQQKARLAWLIVGGAIGIVIGLTAPTLPSK